MRYQPVVGGSYIVRYMDGKSNIEPFCGAAAGLSAIAGFKKQHPATSEYAPIFWETTSATSRPPPTAGAAPSASSTCL
jgi:hypothetical protein